MAYCFIRHTIWRLGYAKDVPCFVTDLSMQRSTFVFASEGRQARIVLLAVPTNS